MTLIAIPISVVPDEIDEGNETFTVTISNPTHATLGTKTENEVTIVDNDTPEASINTTYSAPEASGANDSSGLKVTLSAASTKTVKVAYVFADGTAERGSDYTASNGTLTFEPDETTGLTPTTKFVPFSIIQDSINEANETFTITLSIPDGGNATVDDAKKVATVTIGDDDTTLPIISIADAEGSEGDPDNSTNDGKVTFTISLKTPAGTPVVAGRDIEVNVSTSSPTTGRAIATAGTDYTSLANQKVTIAKGRLSNTFDVLTKQDAENESDETFIVTLSNASHADISTTANKATGTILSDDTPVFEVVDVSQPEGNNNTGNNMEFKVRLSAGVTGEATIDYATSDGPALRGGAIAKAGTDYTETTSIGKTPLRFRAGQQERIIRVPIIGDTQPEHNDTFTLTLSNPSTGTALLVGGESATGTIENDDGLVLSTISVAPATGKARVAEGEMAEFTFSADPVLLSPLEVKISLSDPGNFLDTGIVSTDEVTLNAGATDTKSFATKTANTRLDPDNTVTLTIETDATKYKVGTASSAQVTIEDDFTSNLTGISILALESAITEGPHQTADFQIKSNAIDSSARIINLNISQGDANFLSTQTLNNYQQITIGANERIANISLAIEDDLIFEINGNIVVQIADSGGTSATYNVASSNYSASIAVFDNDFPTADADNSIAIRAIKSSVSETEVAPFQIIAKNATTNVRTIKVSVSNKDSGDFLPDTTYDNPIEVVIGSNSKFANFDVTLDNDSKFEAAGAITATVQAEDLTGGGTATYSVSSNNSAEITVTSEDQDVPIISISSDAETTGVTEGYRFEFEVESDRALNGTALEIAFTVTDNDTGATIRGTTVSIPGNQQVATGIVTMLAANVSSAGANIVIEIDEAVSYDVSSIDPSITVPVKDNDAPSPTRPKMAITSPNYVTDGTMITLTVTASDLPDSATDVKVKLSGDINYLNDPNTLEVTVPFDGTKDTETYMIATKAGSASTNHGIITATIIEGTRYVRSNSRGENRTSFAVVDNLPVISISEIPNLNKSLGNVARSTNPFTFTLTSNFQPIADLPIKITTLSVDDTNTTGPQYYSLHSPNSIEITNLSTNNAATITVFLTADNTRYQGWGELTISLTDGADYTADNNTKTRKVTIIDDQEAPVTVEVSARGSAVEGTTFDVTFAATGTFPTNGSIEVIPTISETGTTTGYYGSHTPQQVTLSAGNTSDSITITLPENTNTEDNGELTISIVRGDGYEVHTINHTKTVQLLDDESLPEVSVTAVSPVIDEGQDAQFELSATGTLSESLEVEVSVDDGVGNFLTNTYTKKTETIPTIGSKVVSYSTIADTDVETNGTITVIVLDDDSDIIKYLAADRGSQAILSVNDNDDNSLPSITIAADQTSINEGDVASFTLTSATTFTGSLSVLVEISETNSGTGDFFAGASNLYTPDRISIDATTLKGEIELPTIPDAIVEDDGTITARIKTDSLDTKTYSVGANHSASIAIVDDDSTTLPTINIIANERDITEGEANAVFTINSSGGTTGATLLIDINISENKNFLNVTAGLRENISIIIGTQYTHTEVIHDDGVDEDSGKITATLQLKNPATYAIGANLKAEINVSDDEGSPEISITPVSASVEEGHDTNLANFKTYTFNVRLNRESTSNITVDFAIGANDDSAKEGAMEDYIHDYANPADRRLTFTGKSGNSAGETLKTIVVKIVGDTYNEAHEQFTVTLSNPTNAGFAGSEEEISATGQITNDDAVPTIYFKSATSEANEGSMINFPVTLSAASGRDVTISYSLTEGSATLGNNDFINPVEADRTLTISALSQEGTISINTIQDTTDEADETFTITLHDPRDTTIVTLGAQKSATGTILSDDNTTLSIESKSVNENVGSVTLKVRLANPKGTAISVPWNTEDGTAKAGSDYSENRGTLNFNGSNSDKVKNIIIFITNDNRDEDNQSFTVQLGDINNVTELGRGTGTITIEDNDAPPTVNISTITPQPEDDDSNDPATDTRYSIGVTLSHPSEKDVTVGFSVTAGTAVATHDYVLVNTSNSLAFENLSTSEQITFDLKADNIDEDDETFTLQLTSASNAQFATNVNNPKTMTITDNDAPPVISISSVDVTEGVETGGTFVITQTPVSGKNVAITATYADVSATEGTNEDYLITLAGFTANSRTINFAKTDIPSASATFSIPFTIRDDTEDELTETFTITLSSPNPSTNATIDPNNNVGTGTIYDNDTAPELTIAAETAEIDEASDASFTITANVIPVSGFTYKYQVSQEGDFLRDTVNTMNPQTASPTFTGSKASYTAPLDLMIVDDSEGESTGAVKVELLVADGDTSTYSLGSNFEAEVKVFDDDLPELSIVGVAGPVIEGSGNKVQFTITSSYNIGEISLRYRPTDTGGNFLVGGIADTEQETDLNFNNTNTAILELEVDNDNVVEEDGMVHVQLLNDVFIPEVPASTILGTPRIPAKPIQYTVIDDDTKNIGSVAVQDDDTLPTLPIITLESEYLPTGATTATYYVVANSAPAKDLEVTLEYNYKAPDPENAGSTINLLANWFRTTVTISANQTYESFSQNVNFSAPYRITTPPFIVALTGTLTVRLVDGDNYDLGNPSSSDLPTASTAENPLITISTVGDSRVVESSELRFEVVANPAPAAPTQPTDPESIPVTIYVTQTGNFISESLPSGRLVKSVMIPKTGLNKGRAEFTVGLDDDEVEESANGIITATVQNGAGFVLGSYTKRAIATIYDDDALPAVTIANSDPVSEDAGPAMFTLTAGVSANTDLDVAFIAQNEVGDYLGTQTPVLSPLQFRERSGAYVAEVAVQLDDDQVDEADGSVSVTLITDTTYPFTYKVGAAKKGIATITDDDVPSATMPKITLLSPNYIKEGASFNLVARASHPPENQITVNVTLSSDANNNFLVPSSRGSKTLVIQPNQQTGTISITSQADGTTGNRGLIMAELNSGSGYFTSGVASENMTSVVVLETLPVVSISVDKFSSERKM